MILFTTGRGTPLGLPVPTIKISSNTAISQKKPQWIDFNAGALLEGASNAGQTQRTVAAFDFANGLRRGKSKK